MHSYQATYNNEWLPGTRRMSWWWKLGDVGSATVTIHVNSTRVDDFRIGGTLRIILDNQTVSMVKVETVAVEPISTEWMKVTLSGRDAIGLLDYAVTQTPRQWADATFGEVALALIDAAAARGVHMPRPSFTANYDTWGRPWAKRIAIQLRQGTPLAQLVQLQEMFGITLLAQPGDVLAAFDGQAGRDLSQRIQLRVGQNVNKITRTTYGGALFNALTVSALDGYHLVEWGESIHQWGRREARVDARSMGAPPADTLVRTTGVPRVAVQADLDARGLRPGVDFLPGDILGVYWSPDKMEALQVTAIGVDIQDEVRATVYMQDYVKRPQVIVAEKVKAMTEGPIGAPLIATSPPDGRISTQKVATVAELDGILAPSEGQIVFVRELSAFYIWDEGRWQRIWN